MLRCSKWALGFALITLMTCSLKSNEAIRCKLSSLISHSSYLNSRPNPELATYLESSTFCKIFANTKYDLCFWYQTHVCQEILYRLLNYLVHKRIPLFSMYIQFIKRSNKGAKRSPISWNSTRELRNWRVPARVYDVEGDAVCSKDSSFGYFDGTA